jgi:uncharacterized protein YndB with AHSA1/START domain
MRDSVTVHIDAPADKVWDLVTDITRIGEFSPETFEAEWIGGATGPAIGARFKGHVKRNGRGPTYWAVCEVTDYQPKTEFGFTVIVGNRRVNNWRYELAQTDSGTDVTESFQLEPTTLNKMYWALAGRFRGKTNHEGMLTTLHRMKALLEGAS